VTSLFSKGIVLVITTNATYSNFFGLNAGNGATNANKSNFWFSVGLSNASFKFHWSECWF
jgi:hypothetical protein